MSHVHANCNQGTYHDYRKKNVCVLKKKYQNQVRYKKAAYERIVNQAVNDLFEHKIPRINITTIYLSDGCMLVLKTHPINLFGDSTIFKW